MYTAVREPGARARATVMLAASRVHPDVVFAARARGGPPGPLTRAMGQLEAMGLLLDANGQRIENVPDLFERWVPAAKRAASGVEVCENRRVA